MKEFINKLIDWIRKWKTEPSCNKNCGFCSFSDDCFNYEEGNVNTD